MRTDRGWAPDLCDANGHEVGLWGMETTRIQNYEGTNTMNGLISYLAIYIGFVLVIACAAILTIQQLSSVADSGKNCRILSELGTSRHEIDWHDGSCNLCDLPAVLWRLLYGHVFHEQGDRVRRDTREACSLTASHKLAERCVLVQSAGVDRSPCVFAVRRQR